MKIAHTTAEAVISITNGLNGDFADFAMPPRQSGPKKLYPLIRHAGLRHIAVQPWLSRVRLCRRYWEPVAKNPTPRSSSA
jgi:hypothetical protein